MGTYRRLVAYVWPYRVRLSIAALCMLGVSLANALISVTVYVTLNGLENRTRVIIDNIPHAAFLPRLEFPAYWVPLVIVGVFLMHSLFDYFSKYEMASIGIRALRQIRDDLYRHLVKLDMDFYARGRTGDFMSRILNDVGSIQGAITDVLVDIIQQPLTILFNLPMVFLWGGPYALYAVIVFPLAAVPIVILGKRLRRVTKRMQERSSDITAAMGETLTGIHIVKAFNQEEHEIRRFEAINRSVFDFFKKTIKTTTIQRPLIEAMGAVGTALAVWFALQHLPADRFGAFVGSLFIFYEPLKKLSKVNSTVQQSIASGNRIFEILDVKPSMVEDPRAAKLGPEVSKVSYEHVFFEYEPGSPVLSDIHFEVEKGEVLALVGPSGAGKTSLVNLLLRFYDPVKGRVTVDGVDIKQAGLHSLRSLIGVVSQETVLFNASVAENIAYGKPTAGEEEIRAAARAAHAEGFIEELPEGFKTRVGERGLKLSGGQRQRLAIARALLKNPPILILDEATSHLDTESEREVQMALERLMEGRTVFVIAHRLSTVQRATQILVLEDGRIVQRGTNESLLKAGGVYKRLHDLQFNL
ncbi:MAG: ABC transporter ATP-binding protein [Candidatus Omnitrophica bacterium]|nr:ABC transporter ATP-binding protein [Candidatus Omnitrophota bacterium]